jgi:hypothetical protein
MKKKEWVFLAIALAYVERKEKITQLELSKILGLSLSTVNDAVKELEDIGALSLRQRNFKVVDFEKFMLYWATQRNIKKEIIYSTFVPMKPYEIEANLPGNVVFTAYSGYKITFDDAPADYSKIYVYAYKEDVSKRFPEKKGPMNLFVLQMPEVFDKLKIRKTAPLPLLFVDIWGLEDWYSKEFVKALSQKLFR